jgi:hypothetical protein
MTATERAAPEAGASTPLVAFDYSALSADIADEMRGHASRIHGLQRASVLDVGRELIAAKTRVEHGCFVEWVQKACQMQIRTAQRAMRAAELVGENDKLSYLPPGGLLALASRSAPEPVVSEIVEEIAAGDRPTSAQIKHRIAEAKQTEKRAREQKREGASLQHCERNPAEQETATDELIDMLVTWDRIDEFVRLLETANFSRVVHALRESLANRTATEANPVVGPHLAQSGLDIEPAGPAKHVTGAADEEGYFAPPEPAAGIPMLSEALTHERGTAAELTAPSGRGAETTTNDCIRAAAEATQPASPELSSGISAEELLAIWSLLKPNSQRYGRLWAGDGAKHPQEHDVITEALVPFRAAASKTSDAELQRFLVLTAPQAA